MMLNKTFYLLLLSLIPLLGFSQANSQYPDSGNKIRLGFQTTGDGLIWRDTQPKSGGYQPINNKAAWIILDTINNKFYHYKNSTWILAGGQDIDTANLIATKYNLGFKLSLADTQNMLTPYWRSGRFSGVLPLANGGTGQTTLAAAEINTGSGSANYIPKYTGATTLGNSLIYDNGSIVSITSVPGYTGYQLQISGTNARIVMINNSASNTSNYSQMAFGNGTAEGQYAEFYRQNDIKTFHIYNGGSGKIGLSTRLNSSSVYLYDIYLNEAGNVGIGTTSPQSGYKLHVVDSVYIGGRVSAAGYTTRSDYNLKDEIQTLNYGLNEVIKMQPVKYTYKSNGEQQLGFIAQDIGTLIPESVHFDEFMGVDYQSLIPILTKAIQEQTIIIKQLEDRILILENK